MKQTAIQVSDLTYAYEKKAVLAGVSFSVTKGECFVIIGPNGSGKTTLMKLMAGVMARQSGQILLSGRPMDRISRQELSRTAAYVPQTVSMEFPMTVREYVMTGRAPHQGLLGFETEEDQRRVEDAMAFTGISHLKTRSLNSLSGGERQRTGIAAAICQEPAVMFLDEPTSALDPAHQIRIMDLLSRLSHENGLTVVMVLHDITLASQYADSVLILKGGKVFAEGSAKTVLTRNILEDVYECRFSVSHHSMGNVPFIIPVPYAKSLNTD